MSPAAIEKSGMTLTRVHDVRDGSDDAEDTGKVVAGRGTLSLILA